MWYINISQPKPTLAFKPFISHKSIPTLSFSLCLSLSLYLSHHIIRATGGFPSADKPLEKMRKVHPNTVSDGQKRDSDSHEVEVLTVWKKSLLFNCYGFTVFDTKGNLVFRVDNYVAGNSGEIVLMDGSGLPLLTIRRKKLSLGDHWLVFRGEETADPLFSVKKNVNFLNPNALAHVTVGCGASPKRVIYGVEGSYAQRSCTIYDDSRRSMAEIKCKEPVSGVTFGLDVFRLIVQPGFDSAEAMSIVIAMEQMYGSRRFLN